MSPLQRFLFAFFLLFPIFPAQSADGVYSRVMQSGVLRCGYGLWGNYLAKDPNTGQMSGLYYDLLEQLGKNLSLKIEWTEETGWGDQVAALENNRFDAYCTVVAYNAERARQVDYVRPVLYMVGDVFVKEGDMRFDGHPELLNAPTVKLATSEGDVYDKISRRDFPQAQIVPLSQLVTQAEYFMTVAQGKADAIITEVSAAQDFMAHNPGKIRRVPLSQPLILSPTSFTVKGGEYRFRRMLDMALTEMTANGSLDRILDKYYPRQNASIVRVARDGTMER